MAATPNQATRTSSTAGGASNVESGRVPPQSLEAEMATLASMALDRDVLGEIIQIVRSDHFYRQDHRLIFDALVHLYEANKPVDLILLRVQVTSDEADDGLGDGDTAGDVFGEDGFTTPVNVTSQFVYNSETATFEGTIFLRAERDAIGDGRAYTVEAYLVDNSLNLTSTSCVVVVPHDRRRR